MESEQLTEILQQVPRWSYRDQGLPTCAVVRHAERADSNSWDRRYSSLDYCLETFPSDPRLSARGEKQAAAIGHELFETSSGGSRSATSSEDLGNNVFGIVVSSPYLRCVQTAAHLCRAGGIPLLLDYSLGEVYGPDVMGDNKPDDVLRSIEEGSRYCRALGVELRSKIVGQWPTWPEAVGSARVRYVQRFLQYLRRSEVTKRNFILVTHGHGVAAMLGTMPAMESQTIKSVDLGGYFIARAVSSTSNNLTPISSSSDFSNGSTCKNSGMEVGDDDSEEAHDCVRHWEVTYSKVKVGRRTEESLSKRIRRWAGKSRYNEQQISKLLFVPQSKTPESPTDACQQTNEDLTDSETDQDSFSDTGASTTYFGASPQCSPSKTYIELCVSPRQTPPKSLMEWGTQNSDKQNGRSDHSPEKLYCEVGVSPFHSPVKKAYEPSMQRKEPEDAEQNCLSLKHDYRGGQRRKIVVLL